MKSKENIYSMRKFNIAIVSAIVLTGLLFCLLVYNVIQKPFDRYEPKQEQQEQRKELTVCSSSYSYSWGY